MTKRNTWVLVADASKARLFSLCKLRVFQNEDKETIQTIGDYIHSESRLKSADLSSDKLGEYGHSTFEPPTDLKTRESENFARELCGYLKVGLEKNQFQDLILVAPPHFMGILRKQMPADLKKLVSQNIEKDYTRLNEKELLRSLLVFF